MSNSDSYSRVVHLDPDVALTDVATSTGPIVSNDPRVVQRDVIGGPQVDAVTVAPVAHNVVVHEVPVAHRAAVLAEPAVRTSYTRRFAPDAMIASAVGLILLLVGLIAMTRGGFEGPMSLPVFDVLGFTHTTTLGMIEVVLGACLLISGATSTRSGAIFFGSVLGIGGFVGAVQTESFRENLALESGMAWLCVLAAVFVVASALLMPRFITRSTRVRPL